MDQSYSESDISLSPTQVLERLQVLRQLQLLQRGKLQKQHLQYQEPADCSSSLTEIVSHFSNSTSYNTFRSLLRSSHDTSTDHTPRLNTSDLSQKVNEKDLIDGVSVLNLSQESEFIANSPISARNKVSTQSKAGSQRTSNSPLNNKAESKLIKKISLDEMPILSPKKDFEAMILEKLQSEKSIPKEVPCKDPLPATRSKKAFLKRGEGMARYGLKKNDLIIQNTKSLPWHKKGSGNKSIHSSSIKESAKPKTLNKEIEVEILTTPQRKLSIAKKSPEKVIKSVVTNDKLRKSAEIIEKHDNQLNTNNIKDSRTSLNSNKNDSHNVNPLKKQLSVKRSVMSNKGKTWAAALTKEQDDFLRQLKQSDYYKNFESPTKSIISDTSCDDNLSKLRQEREAAEQNMFELLENKVTHESFNMDNSFFNQFLRRTALELSGESTPLMMQKCLANNPNLLNIFPNIKDYKKNEISNSDVETCNSDYTECCSETCSTISSCCSCKTVEETNNSTHHTKNDSKNSKTDTGQKSNTNGTKKKKSDVMLNNDSHNDTALQDDIKTNMAEMNAKLVATSELLKDRLRELEDEIETFRKENANLGKMKEEVDLERQKFYEEKAALEQKFNEDKILSEYYLAEEKEKLSKQKQMYDKYVREMRGRLNKKDKDEVINFKKEINDLKEEIRMKDAKSTSTIARLRNQIKLMEKEKKESQDQIEKLKKENRRIQHSNDITRRLTNIKYLEQINKKLTKMSTQNTQSEVHLDPDVKYKAFEIERQSRSRKVQSVTQNVRRPRAKSVPNLKVTSRYAKYFSQRDTVSQMENNKTLNEGVGTYTYPSDSEEINDNEGNQDNTDKNVSDSEDENYLEKIYLERFQSKSPVSNRSSLSNSNESQSSTDKHEIDKSNGFFIKKSAPNTSRDFKSSDKLSSASINNSSRSSQRVSPISIFSCRSSLNKSPSNDQNSSEFNRGLSNYSVNRSKSPMSILSNHLSGNERLNAVVNNDQYRDKLMTISPEPLSSKSSVSKTNLNPTELRKSDGTRELRFPNGNIKYISADGKYSKFVYYNGDVKENFYNEGRIKYFYAETKTFHTTHADGLEVLEFPDGQVEKRYKDGSSEIRLPNGSIRYFDPKNEHVREEWRFPDGAALTVSANGEQRIVFSNGQVEVHAKDHKRREFPDGTVKLVYTDGTSETRYASGRVRIKDKHGNLIMDSAPG